MMYWQYSRIYNAEEGEKKKKACGFEDLPAGVGYFPLSSRRAIPLLNDYRSTGQSTRAYYVELLDSKT